jgi:hypothetical protein
MAQRSMKLGKGGRFKKLTRKIEKRGYSKARAKAAAAAIGRRKYGAKKMARMAAAGRRSHARG